MLYILYQHTLFQTYPFTIRKAFSFYQGNLGTTHFVFQRQTNHVCSRSNISCFSPQEIAGFISAHTFRTRVLTLVLLHFKLIGSYFFRRSKRIITIDINVSGLVLPIDIIGRIPFLSGFIERMTDIVSSISVILQFTRLTTLIIHNIHPHHIAIAKAAIIHTTNGYLFNFTRQRNTVHLFRNIFRSFPFIAT